MVVITRKTDQREVLGVEQGFLVQAVPDSPQTVTRELRLAGMLDDDAGFDSASDVIHGAYGDRFIDLPDPEELRDPKTRLQEFLQSRKLELPVYEIIDITGKAHKQTFTVACMVAALNLKTTGAGGSRRDAEQVAAAEMFERLRDERP